MEKASFAAGCFWNVEKKFQNTRGVMNTQVGYSGGTAKNPSYEQVKMGDTGHAETVEVEYDPNQVSYAGLLSVFWQIHDPTTADRQGEDVGRQYRSVIFYHSEEQKQQAAKSRARAQSQFKDPIQTQIVPALNFYRAEEYHQDYVEKHPPTRIIT